MKQILAKELQLTDRIIFKPELGELARAFGIKALKRTSGSYQVEVQSDGRGTWHYKLNEKVWVKD